MGRVLDSTNAPYCNRSRSEVLQPLWGAPSIIPNPRAPEELPRTNVHPSKPTAWEKLQGKTSVSMAFAECLVCRPVTGEARRETAQLTDSRTPSPTNSQTLASLPPTAVRLECETYPPRRDPSLPHIITLHFLVGTNCERRVQCSRR